MSSEQNIQGFTAMDFERYYAGKMNAAEMHMLEKAALDDPFLNDALEGYKNAASPEKDIEHIKNIINKRSSKKRKVFYLQPLLKIAAVLILVAGLSWLIFKDDANFNKGEKIILANKQEQPKPIIQADSGLTTASNAEAYRLDSQFYRNKNIEPASSGTVKQLPANSAQVENIQNNGYLNTGNDTSKIQSELAAIPAPVTDNVLSGKFESKDKEFETNVTASNKRMKSEQTVFASTAVIIIPYFTSDNAEPVIGWTMFNEALKKNIAAYRKDAVITDVFTASFKINSKGLPVNVKTKDGNCKVCKAEAEKIIQAYQWKIYKGNKASVTVSYK